MDFCDYSYSKKQRLLSLTDSSYLRSKFSGIYSALDELKIEADRIQKSVGEVSQKAKTNYNNYSKCEHLVRGKMEEINSKIKNTPKQIQVKEYIQNSNGEGEWVTKSYPNPELVILESRRNELESTQARIDELLEKLKTINDTYEEIYEIYTEYLSAISNAQTGVKSAENQADKNFQAVEKCINIAEQAILQCLKVRMDRSYGVNVYIKPIRADKK